MVLIKKIKSNSPVILILGGILVIILIFFSLKHFGLLPFGTSHNTNGVATRDKRSLEKVGAENIYNEELNMEYSFYPLPRNPKDTNQFLLKIAKDSIILQGGAQDGYITLDSSFYNAVTVDYLKRMQMVTKVKNAISANENTITGSIITIFFYNNGPGTIGYDKGKALAYAKISQLHNEVVNNKMTMQQAAAAIQNDATLAEVDKEYKSNAYLSFTVTPGEPITYDNTFNSLIKQLQPGQTTAIYTGKDTDRTTNKIIDAVYMFARVDKVKNDGSNTNFDQWYAQKQKEYETTIY
jgi:hypothetical protein